MDFITIKELFASKYYSIPDYQRDYEWTTVQNLTLWDDICDLLISSDTNLKHFIGAIVTVPYEEVNGINKTIEFSDYSIPNKSIRHIVDGQQRLTSLSLLIAATRNVISNNNDIVTQIKNNCVKILDGLLLGDDVRSSDLNQAPKLILNNNTGKCYNNDILGKRDEVANKTFRGAKRLLAIYKLYNESVVKKCNELVEEKRIASETEYYRMLVNIISTRLTLVEITCDASSNAFQVFDSLNGKGLDLTAADRIKNIMLSWASPNDKAVTKWEGLVERTTDDYLANYFITLFFYNCKERISKNKLPEKFRDVYQDTAKYNYSQFFETLKESAALYGDLRLCRTENKELNELLKDLKQLNLDQVYVLLFAVAYHYRLSDILNKKEYLTLVKSLTALLVRMQICEKSMNKLDLMFKTCIKSMREANADINLIIQIVNDKKKGIMDSVFCSSFAQFSTTDNKLSEFYLRHIENYRRRLLTKDRTLIDRDLTVEHIIPQTLDDLTTWYGNQTIPPEIEDDFKMGVQQNIGNKALLYGDDNSSAGNNNYQAKLQVYINGKKNQKEGTPEKTFQLIADLIQSYPSQFNHEEVAKRAKELANIAVKIW